MLWNKGYITLDEDNGGKVELNQDKLLEEVSQNAIILSGRICRIESLQSHMDMYDIRVTEMGGRTVYIA